MTLESRSKQAEQCCRDTLMQLGGLAQGRLKPYLEVHVFGTYNPTYNYP